MGAGPFCFGLLSYIRHGAIMTRHEIVHPAKVGAGGLRRGPWCRYSAPQFYSNVVTH